MTYWTVPRISWSRPFLCIKNETGATLMFSETDIQYALESTRVLVEPIRRIDTFGESRFSFELVSELMDEVGVTRIRSGWVEMERPKIIRPEIYREIETEGFGDEAKKFFEWLSQQGSAFNTLLQYGFQFRRSDVHEEVIHEPFEEVTARLEERARREDDPFKVLLVGVDDSWEVCLLKFAVEMVEKSHEINLFDFRRKGLL
jgi:hypothetical protein